MKRYRSPLMVTAFVLSASCLALLASAAGTPAMGQTDCDAATPSQAGSDYIADEDACFPDGLLTDATGSDMELSDADGADMELLDADGADMELLDATGSDMEPLEVVRVLSVRSDIVITAETGQAEEMLSQAMNADPSLNNAVVKLSDGSRRMFPIVYGYDCLDGAGTGLFMLPGTIVPPDGCLISPELAGTELAVFLYSPEEPCELPVVSAEPLSRTRFILAEHAGLDDLLADSKFDRDIYYVLEGGLNYHANLSWDFDSVPFGTPGTYRLTARPVLPDGILLPDGVAEPACDIVIQKDGVFLLGPPEFTGLYMICWWTMETPEWDKLRCFYAVGDGPWIEDTAQDLIEIPRSSPQSMQVLYYYEDVFFETPYYFRLSYDGEYSNTLKVYFSEGQIHYRFYDGDRDGGDRDDQTLPDVTQPVTPPTDSVGPEETLPPETSGPEASGPEETLPPETSAPETSAPEETLPDESLPQVETPAPGHSGGNSGGGSSGPGNPLGDGFVNAGPGLETSGAASLPSSGTPAESSEDKEGGLSAPVSGAEKGGPSAPGANLGQVGQTAGAGADPMHVGQAAGDGDGAKAGAGADATRGAGADATHGAGAGANADADAGATRGAGADAHAGADAGDGAKAGADAGDGAKAGADAGDGADAHEAGAALQTGPESILEEDTADFTVHSGRRLQKYRELNPGRPLLITKHRIQVEIPLENSVFSDLADTSLLRVEILPLSDDTIQVELSVDGIPVPPDQLPELTVTMPCPAAGENAALQVTGPDGTVLETTRAADSARITFSANQTGVFRVQAAPASGTDSAARGHSPLMPAALTVLFLAALSVLWYLRRFRQNGQKTSTKGGEEP